MWKFKSIEATVTIMHFPVEVNTTDREGEDVNSDHWMW